MSGQQPWTVRRLIHWTAEYFARARLDEPRLSAETLLAHVLDCPRLSLYTRFDRALPADRLAAFRELVRRARQDEPVAYLVGHKEFYSLSFKVTPDVLVPRPETELLVDAALEFVKADGGACRLWDVCTGSGCVAIAAAHYASGFSVLATDISAPALGVAGENVARHALGSRVRLAQADLLALPDSASDMTPFDVITGNPPYIAEGQMPHLHKSVRHEPDVALRGGPTGLEPTLRIIHDAPGVLRPGGMLALETGLGMADDVCDLFNKSGRFEGLRILKDATDIERTVVGLRKP